ncbi:MAG TPA: cytochrome c biogenesis protein CcdA [Thermoanaerobaculia bacterium]|jgi:thiol:disulfide interchange protein DsbD|nr:cytochrome c biogenesis protein CcdA [Thermoanaerobaculia bacterium]
MRLRLCLLLSLSATTLFAQFGDPVVPPAVKLSGTFSKSSGDQVTGVATVVIPSPWHINSAKPLDSFAIPTVLSFDPATAELVDAKYPAHELKAFSFSGNQQIAVYEGTIQIPFTAKVKGDKIKASLRYQSCNDKVCLPPKTIDAELSMVAAGAAGATQNPASFTALANAPKNPAPASGDRLASTFAASGLPLTLLIIFVGGLALNLTPCVFPMIPITMGFFAMQSDGRRSRRFALAALYVLGIVIMYSSLGVVASLGGKMFGAWLQQPAVQIGFAALMLILASSMFGAFDIGVPQFIANRAMGRAGLAGAMTMGLLVGIVAAPCVGPVVVSLITLVASIGRPLIGFVMFAALALGLGFPYLVMLNALPRPGEWMVHVKKSMGFVLVAMSVYFLRPLIGETWFHYGVAASLLVGAVFLVLMSARSAQARPLRLACAAALLIGGVAFAIPARKGGAELTWQHYDQASVLGVPAAEPAVIDFYADWCIPCKELDAKTFSDKGVAAELKRFRRVKADLTLPDDPKTKALTKQYAIVGVPTVVFLDSKGNELRDLRLTGFEEPEKFLARAKQAH